MVGMPFDRIHECARVGDRIRLYLKNGDSIDGFYWTQNRFIKGDTPPGEHLTEERKGIFLNSRKYESSRIIRFDILEVRIDRRM